MVRGPVTLYLEKEPYKRLKDLVAPKKVSTEVDELILRRIAELEGQEYVPNRAVDYEGLKRKHGKLLKEGTKMKETMRKQRVYDRLVDLAANLGIDENLKNVSKVAKGVLEQWENRQQAHLFVTYMEVCKKLNDVQKKLEHIRLDSLP